MQNRRRKQYNYPIGQEWNIYEVLSGQQPNPYAFAHIVAFYQRLMEGRQS